MNNPIFFKELFKYNLFANTQLFALLPTHAASEKALKLASHILNAEEIWISRINDTPAQTSVWALRDVNTLVDAAKSLHNASMSCLDTVDLMRSLSYTNSMGASYTNTVNDILFHVINHSTYHRAQIATEIKQQGIAPPPTDYIFYKR
jgi:uncharacterized damage-inducible protein DinB